MKAIVVTDHAGTAGMKLVEWPEPQRGIARQPLGRESSSPRLGDGWGWALFKPDAPGKQVATGYKKDCLPCHEPSKVADWVYVKGYPVPIRGKSDVPTGPPRRLGIRFVPVMGERSNSSDS